MILIMVSLIACTTIAFVLDRILEQISQIILRFEILADSELTLKDLLKVQDDWLEFYYAVEGILKFTSPAMMVRSVRVMFTLAHKGIEMSKSLGVKLQFVTF